MDHFLHNPKCMGLSVRRAIANGDLPLLFHGHAETGEGLEGEKLVILRDPMDRFFSAVNWMNDKVRDRRMGNLVNEVRDVENLIRGYVAGDVRSADFMGMRWRGERHVRHFLFLPQIRWARNATKVIRFDDAPAYFRDHYGVELPVRNRSDEKVEQRLGNAGSKWLRDFYLEDFQLWEGLKNG